MTQRVSRLRMFAGPNGSGKSTIKSVIDPKLLGIYIDPDELEKEIREKKTFSFESHEIETSSEEIQDFFLNSTLLQKAGLSQAIQYLCVNDQTLSFNDIEMNSYFASVLADFIRNKLLASQKSFSFETVMSFPDKVELLRKAQLKGYRTYLYYVATEDPAINIARVRNRVALGGHPVPEDKIVNRYYRSLELLMDVVQPSNRAYIFDNSSHEHIWLAELTDGRTLEMKTDLMPMWFKTALWDKFSAAVETAKA